MYVHVCVNTGSSSMHMPMHGCVRVVPKMCFILSVLVLFSCLRLLKKFWLCIFEVFYVAHPSLNVVVTIPVSHPHRRRKFL